jgi:hypothetical protein
MTRSRRRWICSSAVALAALVALRPAPAAAQACCAGGALVTPTRLSAQEDFAAAVQMRARSTMGSFAANGGYASAQGVDQAFEQDLAGAFRLGRAGQAGAVLPLIQQHRNLGGTDEWGSGIGDLALTGRYDFRLAADAVPWPGIALLAGATFPTGRPVERATQPLATDATGAGTYDVTLGVGLERVGDHAYAALDGFVTHHFTRTVSVAGAPPVTHAYSLRFTALAVGGYVFDNEAALALYASLLAEGNGSDDGVTQPGTSQRLTTVGAAGLLPLRELWRLQGSIFTDVMLSSFGRNEPAGVGLTVALVRVWL